MGLSLHFVCLFVDFFSFSFLFFFINAFCAFFSLILSSHQFFFCAMCSFLNFVLLFFIFFFIYIVFHFLAAPPKSSSSLYLETRLRESLYKILSEDECTRMIHGKHNTTLLISYLAAQEQSDISSSARVEESNSSKNSANAVFAML